MNKSDGFYVEPLVYSIGLHMGLQWAILNATDVKYRLKAL